MSRKFRHGTGVFNKEAKWARQVWARTNRHVTRNKLRSGRHEDVTAPRRTSGWMTW